MAVKMDKKHSKSFKLILDSLKNGRLIEIDNIFNLEINEIEIIKESLNLSLSSKESAIFFLESIGFNKTIH